MLEDCFAAFPDMTPNCQTRYNGITPFMHVVMMGNTDMALYFLQKGADTGQQSAYGDKPLDFALRAGHEDVAMLLLDHGADCAYSAKDGTLLRLAVMDGKVHDEALLMRLAANAPVSGEAGDDALRAACYSGNISVVALLLSRGAMFQQDTAYEVSEKFPDSPKMLTFLQARGIQTVIKKR